MRTQKGGQGPRPWGGGIGAQGEWGTNTGPGAGAQASFSLCHLKSSSPRSFFRVGSGIVSVLQKMKSAPPNRLASMMTTPK